MTKKTITPSERLQLLGLLTLAQQAYEKEQDARQAVKELVGDDDDTFSTFDDWFSDGIYGEYSIDKILKSCGIKVGETK